MALQKTFTLPNNQNGSYIRIGAYRWDRVAKEASAELLLYTDATFAAKAAAQPICLIARLRLVDAKFDQYLANSVLDGQSVTVVGQLYLAAKNEPLKSGAGLPNAALGLPAVDLSDAANV